MKSSNKPKRERRKYLVLQRSMEPQETYTTKPGSFQYTMRYRTDFLLLALFRMITLKRSSNCRLRLEWR